jgi:hypothetical protein
MEKLRSLVGQLVPMRFYFGFGLDRHYSTIITGTTVYSQKTGRFGRSGAVEEAVTLAIIKMVAVVVAGGDHVDKRRHNKHRYLRILKRNFDSLADVRGDSIIPAEPDLFNLRTLRSTKAEKISIQSPRTPPFEV